MLDDSQKLDDSQDHEGHWVAVSDLMAGLMMVFMLVSVVFMINVETASVLIILMFCSIRVRLS